MNTQELMQHHRHLRESIKALDEAAPHQSKADRKRAEWTRKHLHERVREIDAAIRDAAGRAKK